MSKKKNKRNPGPCLKDKGKSACVEKRENGKCPCTGCYEAVTLMLSPPSEKVCPGDCGCDSTCGSACKCL